MKKILQNLAVSLVPLRHQRKVLRNYFDRSNKKQAHYELVMKNLHDLEKLVKFQHYLSACLIIKDEAVYIQEFIEYHLHIGVDHFYIYDNDSSDNLDEVLKPYVEDGLVDLIKFPGNGQQGFAYADAISKFKNETKWMAFIDTDEFIVTKHSDLISMLKNNENNSALFIKYVLWGDQNELKYRDGLVIERFRKHDDLGNNHNGKSIINPRMCGSMTAHQARIIDNSMVAMPSSDICVNHYRSKSLEEYMERRGRFIVTIDYLSYGIPPKDEIKKRWFKETNKVNILDDSMDKYVPIIKGNIRKRVGK